MYGIGGARITVHDTLAFAAPVTVLSEWRSISLRVTFRREPVGWRIYSQEVISTGPPELGMAGLGEEYVALMERCASANLTWVQRSLRANPPNGGSRRLRRDALLRLDEPLHLLSAPRLRPIQDFLTSNIDSALAQMRRERVTEGATIWKLYNHGWVIRTPNHTWAHDFCEGQEPAVMTDAQIDGILDQVEALFLSHWHGDHSSPPVMKRAIARGIPVLTSSLPPNSEWIAELHRGFGDSTGSLRGITLVQPGGQSEVRGIRYHAYPGHQGDLTNNVFTVIADGMTFMQTGDQSNDDDFAWIDQVKDQYDADVLLPNVWTTNLSRVIRGVRPRVVIPGHENELGHNFEHREPYAQAFEKLEEERDVEWHVLAWGERVHVSAR